MEVRDGYLITTVHVLSRQRRIPPSRSLLPSLLAAEEVWLSRRLFVSTAAPLGLLAFDISSIGAIGVLGTLLPLAKG